MKTHLTLGKLSTFFEVQLLFKLKRINYVLRFTFPSGFYGISRHIGNALSMFSSIETPLRICYHEMRETKTKPLSFILKFLSCLLPTLLYSKEDLKWRSFSTARYVHWYIDFSLGGNS